MVLDVEPLIFPPRNVGGEFVGNVPIAGLLSKLDAGAPYNCQTRGHQAGYIT
jgi:hypothetical protein